jgi:hypothetical protein
MIDPKKVSIRESERWLFENPEALAAVTQGLKDSAEAKREYIASFAQYADLEIDENCTNKNRLSP